MSPSRNAFIDFDGTLVLENSSTLLMQALMARASSPGEKLLASALTGPTKRLVQFALGAATRLASERDITLLLVLWTFRNKLKTHGEAIMAELAAGLTLNPMLADEYTRPFAIASTGLRPVIEVFLELHPELPCTGVYASSLLMDGPKFSVRLLTLRSKVRTLDSFNSTSYFTDYGKEAALYRRLSKLEHDTKVIPDADGNTIFRMTIQK